MVCNSAEETEARFKPLCEYLSRKLGMNFVPVTIDTIEFEQAVRDKKVDFTHTNSLLYVILNKNYGVEILAGDKNGKYGSKSRGAIIVRKDSPIKTLADLKGKRMVFGPMLAPTGYLSQYNLLLKNGFNPETDLAFYTIPQGSYKHEKVIYSLLYGDFDAAAAPMLDFELMARQGKINPDDFRIIAQEDPIPYCSFGVCEHVDEDLSKKVKEALLSLKPEDTTEYQGERLKVLKSAMVEGFVEVKDSDYDIVRDMAKACNMPPYQKF
ncbi:MAG: phosphate/phosphite/phosphonate ABC transporter substrate-binding protein [Nitrospirota bacterium]